jgi:Protein of unknown function (DUF4232)
MNAQVQLARTPAKLAGRAAALSLIAAVSAACGSAAPPGAGQAAPPGRAAAATAGSSASPAGQGSPSGDTLTACATADLKVTLDTSAAGVAAGSSYVPLEFTNASGRSCTLSGYPAVTFSSSAAGSQIGAAAVAEVKTTPILFTLAPGGAAHAWLQIADIASYPASKCRPVQASGLRVGLVSTQAAVFLPHSFQACARAMPGSTLLAVFPVQAGRAKRGTAP